jgi:hypothetical protein
MGIVQAALVYCISINNDGMKRRSFLRKTAIGGPGLVAVASAGAYGDSGEPPAYSYGQATSFRDIIGQEGHVMLRLEIAATESEMPLAARIRIQIASGNLLRTFTGLMEEEISGVEPEIGISVTRGDTAVLTMYIGEARESTELRIYLNEHPGVFTLGDLVRNHQIEITTNEFRIGANYLLDREIGRLRPETLSIGGAGSEDEFTVAVLADPQGGDPDTPGAVATRMKIHNAFIEDSINIVNQLKPSPAFTLVLGDVVDQQGEASHFAVLHRYLKRVRSPVLYALGNHESIYRAKFSPGYRMEDFNNYFAAQKAMNGLELLLYSFDLGEWHFIVWPDPLRSRFWENHPHYFEWLNRDLDTHRDRPVVFFQHVPVQPIGLDPLIGYTETASYKRRLLEILGRSGNVKYIFSGHVHIPIRASRATAVRFREMQLINLPAAGYRPRGFGEEELHGGPSQGVMVLRFKGRNAKAFFKTVAEEVYPYPDSLPELRGDEYPLWLSEKWELPAHAVLLNGDFESGLGGWSRQYVYTESGTPSNRCEVRAAPGKPRRKALYLACRKRGYDAPGQDRMPQSINHIAQAVRVAGRPAPLQFDYLVDIAVHDPDAWSGAYLWVEGYRGRHNLLSQVYWIGKAYAGLGGPYGSRSAVPIRHFSLAGGEGEQWRSAVVDVAADFEREGLAFPDLQLDRLCISLGVWHINDGEPHAFGIWFTGLQMRAGTKPGVDNGNRVVPSPFPDEHLWRMGKFEPFRHVAGEHHYIRATPPVV